MRQSVAQKLKDQITEENFRPLLKMIGYYEGKPFKSEKEIRKYLNIDNKLTGPLENPIVFDCELEKLADLAIKHKEFLKEAD